MASSGALSPPFLQSVLRFETESDASRVISDVQNKVFSDLHGSIIVRYL